MIIFPTLLCFALASLTLSAAVSATGPKDDPTRQTEESWIDDRWNKTDIGPFLGGTYDTPKKRTNKGIAVKLGDSAEAAICFDTDLLRYSAGWTGRFVEINSRRYGLMAAHKPGGKVLFSSAGIPGWSDSNDFKDPRPRSIGPLPKSWAKYNGMHLAGNRVAFVYTIAGTEVLDTPWFSHGAFIRSLEIPQPGKPLTAHLLDLPSATITTQLLDGVSAVFLKGDAHDLWVTLNGDGELLVNESAVQLKFPQSNRPLLATVTISTNRPSPDVLASSKTSRPGTFRKPGPPRWTRELKTTAIRGKDDKALALDTIPLPFENPWNALMFASGHDFLPGGKALLATAHGDVWLLSGLNNWKEIKWQRFATGLYQPLGLKVLNGKIHVLERDQITILHDLNNDGETDFYENFNNDCISNGGSHSYSACLETDSSGNFYFVKCAEDTPHGGALLKVSANGEKIEVIATGFRNPNGLGVGPQNQVTVADQQGDWVPETRLDLIKPGGFYGYMPMHKRATKPENYDAPWCWIPRTVDNSAGGQVWVPPSQWGQLSGKMLHLSYGRCHLLSVVPDTAKPTENAGVSTLLKGFLSGAMRGRFNPHDGHLYVSGLRGWQTAALRDGCFQRVRHTGTPFYTPVAWKSSKNTLEVTFDSPLDKESATDVGSYSLERWNYKWSATYGSFDYSLKDKNKNQRDKVEVTSATLKDNGKTLVLQVEELLPVMQMQLRYQLLAADGTDIPGEFSFTINSL